MIDLADKRRRVRFCNGAVIATAGTMLASALAGFTVGLYLAGMLGSVAAWMLGFFGAQYKWVDASTGTFEYAKPWFWFTAFSALSLIHGMWQPVVFFGGIGVGLSLLYWLGAWVGSRTPPL